MKRERRHFDRDFKLMVVSLVNTGKSTNEIAEELGIASDLVRHWKREQEEFKEGSSPAPNDLWEVKCFLEIKYCPSSL
jgi:transposase-like protein